MQEKSQNALFIIIIVLFVILGVSILLQQRTISSLQEKIPSVALSNPANQEQQKPKLPDYLVETTKKDLIDNTKDITGEVNQVKNNVLTIDAEVVDLDKIAEATSAEVKDLPKIKKTFNVLTDSKTEFLSFKLDQIKSGDPVKAYFDSSVYDKSDLTATKISCPFVSSPSTSVKFVSGKVEKINGNTISIKSNSPNNQKTYTITLTDKTKVTKIEVQPPKETAISLSDIKVGDGVTAVSSEVIGDKTSFEAIILQMIMPSTAAPPKQ